VKPRLQQSPSMDDGSGGGGGGDGS